MDLIAASTASTIGGMVLLAILGVGAVGGFLLGWIVFSNVYAGKRYQAVQAAKAQARSDAWIEFQQYQANLNASQAPPTS